jgi:hypothetical protein
LASAKVLVLDPRDLVAADRHVAAPRQTERLDTGRAVERCRDRRAPVDHQRVQLVIGDREPTDVVDVGDTDLVGHVVDAPEEEGLVPDGQLIESVEGGAHDDITLDQVARTSHVRHGRAVAQ